MFIILLYYVVPTKVGLIPIPNRELIQNIETEGYQCIKCS